MKDWEYFDFVMSVNDIRLKLHAKFKKGYTDILVGQCIEFPPIIVQAKTKQGIEKQMIHGLEGLFIAFPDEKIVALDRYSIPDDFPADMQLEKE